jgi:subtilisin family serine protease
LGNQTVARLRTPPDMHTVPALELARQRVPQLTMDLTHLYRPAQATAQRATQPVPVAYPAELVGFYGGANCPVATRIGLIDTDLAAHPALSDAPIRRRGFVANDARTSTVHGTAIASMLVGQLPGVLPLAPGAALYAGNVFAYEGEALRSDVTAILAALDWMAEQEVAVVNLSLMGPPNELLERGVLAAAQRGQILLAAAGNSGPGAPAAYPAAYPPVIAVAAVDARIRPYPRNNRGNYIAISAPGVDIWGADARGGEAFWTGTSFAVPFAVAAVAREVALGRVRDANDAQAALARSAQDLGAPGRDPIFGFGLLHMGGCS